MSLAAQLERKQYMLSAASANVASLAIFHAVVQTT
jgi:hypothetical protein